MSLFTRVHRPGRVESGEGSYITLMSILVLLKSWLKSDIGILGQIICVMFLDIFNPEALRLNVKLYMKMLDKSLLGRVRFRHIPSSNVYNSYQYFSLLSLHKIRLNPVTLLLQY